MNNPQLKSYLILDAFSLRLKTREGIPPFPLLFNIILEVSSRAIKEEREIETSRLARKK